MKSLVPAGLAAGLLLMSPIQAMAQVSPEELLKRLEKLENENRELRRDLEAIRNKDIVTAAAPVRATTEPPPPVQAQLPASDEWVALKSDYSYAMLDPTTALNRKQKLLLTARRDGALRTGGVYLSGAVTALADYQKSNRNNKFGYLMRHPTSANQIGEEVSEAVLHSAQLGLTANVTPWLSAYAELLYDPEQSFGAGTVTALARNQIQLRKGYVLIGDLKQSPFYASIGKMEAPFGLNDTVNPFTASTVWHAFGGLSWGALVGYSKGGLNISAQAVQGGAQFRALNVNVAGTAVPSRLNNYVLDANYSAKLGPDRELLVGASYERGSAYCQAFPVQHFNGCTMVNPAYAVYGKLRWDRLTVIGDFAETTKAWPGTFNPAPPLNAFAARKVTSFDIGAKYSATISERNVDVSIDYSTFIAGPKGAPWRRQDQWVAGVATFPRPNVKLFSEVLLIKGYAPLNFISGGNLAAGATVSDAGAQSEVILTGLNIAF